jgi:hypothetical protein
LQAVFACICDAQLIIATAYAQVGIEYIYSGLPVTTTVAGYNGATAANATYANYGKVSIISFDVTRKVFVIVLP